MESKHIEKIKNNLTSKSNIEITKVVKGATNLRVHTIDTDINLKAYHHYRVNDKGLIQEYLPSIGWYTLKKLN